LPERLPGTSCQMTTQPQTRECPPATDGPSDRRARAGRERECASVNSSLLPGVVRGSRRQSREQRSGAIASICQGSLVPWPAISGACALARPRPLNFEKYATTLIPNPFCRPVSFRRNSAVTEAVGLRRSSGVGCTADVRTPSGPNPSVSPLFRQSEAMKLDARHPEKKQKGVMCVAYGKALTQDS